MFDSSAFILADNCYMKLKLESIKKASVPNRQVKQLDRIVQNYKPVSDHKHNVSTVFSFGSTGWLFKNLIYFWCLSVDYCFIIQNEGYFLLFFLDRIWREKETWRKESKRWQGCCFRNVVCCIWETSVL